MIKIENLNYIYQPGMPDERQALFDINLTIPDGALTAIIGHTGSGKSTLIQHFNGLIKPTSGKIFINNTDITDKNINMRDVRRNVGLVFQYPEYQLFEETVYRDIAYGPKNMGFDEEEINRRVLFASSLIGLEEKYLDKSPFELSGGQKRRAAIAGVLAMEPQILILDEPTAGLDPKGRDDILNIIKNLHEVKREMIIIFVSHSMEDVAKTAERVVVMHEGRIDMEGTVPEIFSKSSRLCEIGLNVPQITQLIDKLRYLGYDIPGDIYTVSDAVDILKAMIGEQNV